MLIQILLAIFIGIFFGTITGLIPGIHINLVGIFLVSLSTTLLLKINPIYLILFIAAMAITHTFVDFIPAIFLGCPDGETELSILPGHELLKQGKGYEAVLLSLYGSIFAIFVLILIAWPSTFFFPKIFELTKNIMPWILISVSLLLIIMEKKKIPAIIAFSLSGILGYFVLNFKGLNQPLLPLLTGLFGLSIMITSIKNKTKIPEQDIRKMKFKKRKFIKPLLGSIIASPICSFLPGLGAGQAAIIGNTIAKTDQRGFIVLLGATNTLVMGFSFITLYLLSKTRTGAAAAMKEIIGNLNIQLLILILIVMLISGIISFYWAKHLAKTFSKQINKINYTKLSLGIIILLVIMVGLLCGFLGLFVLILSTALGIYCNSLGVRKTLMMGCLMVPTIILYLS